jgi:TnpA family transposase
LLVCLLARAQVRARDDLAEMFAKRIAKLHQRAREELERIRAAHRQTTEGLVATLAELLTALKHDPGLDDAAAGRLLHQVLAPRGGVDLLLADCEAVSAYHGDNYLPLIYRFYASHRPALFAFARALEFTATSADRSVLDAVDVVLANQHRKGPWLVADVDLGFASEAWRQLVVARAGDRTRTGATAAAAAATGGSLVLDRHHFEVCVFTHLAAELRSGDVAVQGADSYADYRAQLLSWEECELEVTAYCRQLGLPESAEALVAELRAWLDGIAREVDDGYPANAHVTISEQGEPILKRPAREAPAPSAEALEAILAERLPERPILDILCTTAAWTGWPRHFGPLSGSEPKLARPTERYVLTAFAFGCNLGPVQAARHLRGQASAHMLGFCNRRHITTATLEAATRDLINAYHQCALPRLWGDPTVAVADGTKYDLVADSLLAEYHVRYGGFGGIAYHHIADTYVALFSSFIPCGVWEAIYLLEGLLKNTSDIQPTTVHADTQGQSATVFALAYLLGIKLMPRIRNWKDLTFYRPNRAARYRHIDELFGEAIDWDKLATHWQDLLRVVLSIKAGKLSSAVLLRKLGTHSRKNRLYHAFRELGRVIRTGFLLQFLADAQLRAEITASTNKIEAYNGFAKWLFFGGQGTAITDSDPEEQEKRIKYNDLVANAVMLHNVVDMTAVLQELAAEGYPVHRDDLATLSPYSTHNVKRFGDYLLPPAGQVSGAFNGDLSLPGQLG